ncbi:tail fiber protein [Lacinutrix sp. C3R15]|uniref:phage tail protein n=1 Tax=Flavobacteriaceae TaxID=49546 RepID=UPI001C087A86|nr:MULTISPECIES: tail fiber protein [Flavobacteriaceae]MBU2940087.1 tail fiber protein [Lacinutrix sp. C3R15]MDO6623404.1 tail fiber protein [Oceanihabitans sp. 1_MG-2023]
MKKLITTLSVCLCFFFVNTVNAQDAYLGDIKLTAVYFVQSGWMECDGSLLPIAQNTALFSLLGTQYGGDGITTFALPDLRGRVPIGQGAGPGLPSYSQGNQGGLHTTTLVEANLPAHNHSVNAVVEDGDSESPTNNYPAGTKLLDKEYSTGESTTATVMNENMIGNTGSGTAVNNMQPYTTLRYVICVSGYYPTSN